MTSSVRTSACEQARRRGAGAGVDEHGRAAAEPVERARASAATSRSTGAAARDQAGGAVDVDGEVGERGGRGVGGEPVADALAGRLGDAEGGRQVAGEVDEQ